MRVGNQGAGWPGSAGSGKLSTEGKGEAAETGKSASAKNGRKAASQEVVRKDVFETASAHAPRDLFGQGPRLPSHATIDIPPGGMKNLDGRNPNVDPSATRKPGVSLQDVHNLLVDRERLNRDLTDGRVPNEDFMDRIAERDLMDGALESFDPAFVQKARTEGGQHSPAAGPATIIPIDNLGGPGLTTDSRPPLTSGQDGGGGGAGIGPGPGQGGTLVQPGRSVVPRIGADTGAIVGSDQRSQKGGESAKTTPSRSNDTDGGLHGGAKDNAAAESTADAPDPGADETGGTTCEQPRSERDPVGYINDGVDTQMCRDDEGLPPADETSGGRGGDDVGPRGLPEHARVSHQQRDLVGPAFTTQTGADDKERPVTGSTSGSQARSDLDDDIGGPGVGSLRKSGGGGEAGPLWKDLRTLDPIDPSKV